MRKYVTSVLMLLGTLVNAQNIFTVAGLPYTHRDDVDGQAALSAPVGSVYGLLLDNATGRLLFDDQLLVLRLEPDGSLLALVGSGNFRIPLSAGSPLASTLNVGVWRGMAQDSAGAL
jgi:hypothetical protein